MRQDAVLVVVVILRDCMLYEFTTRLAVANICCWAPIMPGNCGLLVRTMAIGVVISNDHKVFRRLRVDLFDLLELS